ncbi:epoxyqueuosine reductase [Anaerosporobacter faecicola]|uniref:epoxyqueuosine reductase n=1 Tax=Anaerosporobacter faecicola TaxID=2718714 RepID=UPI001A9BB61C|nr:epoxyqueuosine reductase [Anaerosporobacter faecicola]
MVETRNNTDIDASYVKETLKELGADLCGIASMDRFDEAPKGFHPRDVLPSCESVIVFAKRFLSGTLACNTTIPYTIVRNVLSDRMDKMAVDFCTIMEEKGILAVPTGTNGPSEYDEVTGRHRNIVSGKHCAQAAGLGVIGRNTLLLTPEYGNMVWLSVILTEAKLEADPLCKEPICNDCNLCVEACPASALQSQEMNQMACWNYAFGSVGEGDWRIKCHTCRDICPFCLGTKNAQFRR